MPQPTPRKHYAYLDVLKILLITLVVFHHAGQPYSDGGWWYFLSRETTPALGPFFSVNAGFFMGLFFLISAYFVPASFAKKGTARFLKDRLIRLGIPLLFGVLILLPALMYAYYVNFRGYAPIGFFTYYADIYFGFGDRPADWTGPSWPDVQFGHLWFIQHLLVYACLYALWQKFFGKRGGGEQDLAASRPPTNGAILLYALVLAVVTFVVRIEYPIDRWAGFLGFIQTEFAHLPQYASLFVLGVMAYRRNWFENIPARTGYLWLAVGVVLALSIYLRIAPPMTKGGWNWGNLNRSVIEAFLCIGLCVGLIVLFRECCNVTNAWLRTLSQNTFAVYLIHVPVLVAYQYLFAAVSLGGVVPKFLLIAVLGVVTSFLLSQYVLRKIPFVQKVL
ncbi:MAG TPA: acyltransferase family protein [Bacilli bacterium]|nr:acyltransferase family protein [Bacilli bacterium]